MGQVWVWGLFAIEKYSKCNYSGHLIENKCYSLSKWLRRLFTCIRCEVKETLVNGGCEKEGGEQCTKLLFRWHNSEQSLSYLSSPFNLMRFISFTWTFVTPVTRGNKWVHRPREISGPTLTAPISSRASFMNSTWSRKQAKRKDFKCPTTRYHQSWTPMRDMDSCLWKGSFWWVAPESSDSIQYHQARPDENTPHWRGRPLDLASHWPISKLHLRIPERWERPQVRGVVWEKCEFAESAVCQSQRVHFSRR